jgi:hypothetical protein
MLNASLEQPFTAGALRDRASSRTAAAAGGGEVADSSSDSSNDGSDCEDSADAVVFAADPAGFSALNEAIGNTSAAAACSTAASRLDILPGSRLSSAAAAAANAAGAEVDFDLFLGQYWPRFDLRLRQGLDPSLVYAGED